MKQTIFSKKPYTSCIKIDGVPILPPLITSEKLKDIRKYQKQAKEVEERLRLRKLVDNEKRLNLKEQLSTSFPKSTNLSNFISEAEDEQNVIKLSCDIQASQYINNEFGILDTNLKSTSPDQIKLDDTLKPRLIRSNSYTLETPSPVLIEHLKRSRSNDKCNPLLCWTSLENLCNDLDLNSNQDYCDSSYTESELKNLTEDESNVTNKKSIQQFITNNVPDNCKEDILALYLKKDKADPLTTTMLLHDILNKLPEEYTKHFMLLLEQKLKRDEAKDKSQQKIISVKCTSMEMRYEKSFSKEFEHLYEHPEKFSTPREDDTNFYSVIDSILNTAIEDKTDKKDKSCENLPLEIRQEKAAIVIQAAIRGYLTRRLLSTEKVQTYIEMIKDAYMCAVQLHTDTLEQIDEADVELHRRLIQQVTAAYNEVYDIFFNTSTTKKMSIISIDRQKKFDKYLRSISSNASFASTKSTPRQKSIYTSKK